MNYPFAAEITIAVMMIMLVVMLYVGIVCELLEKDFYLRHDPTGKILKYGMGNKTKAIFYGIVFPVGIIVIIKYIKFHRKMERIKKTNRMLSR